MRTFNLICWIFVFVCVLAASAVYAKDPRVSKSSETGKNFDLLLTKKSMYKQANPSWTNVHIIRKRSDETEETFPTRHAKHRKRRRCRNRLCSRNTVTVSSRDNVTENQNQTIKDDGDVSNIVTEVKELYNETRVEDYDMITPEKSRINRNVSTIDDSLRSELIDTYDEHIILDDIEREEKNDSFWVNTQTKKDEADDYADDLRPTIIYTTADDQISFHESPSDLLSKLFQNLRNATATDNQDIFKEFNFLNTTNEDPCQKWLNGREKLEKVFLDGLASLPACPCQYPSNIFYDDKIWDERQKKHFRWRDVSGGSHRLDVYKPGAAYCVRSLLMQGTGIATAQHCCYDRRRKLLTRGSGAATPNFVSPEISPILHERIDVLPWRLCKGDFSRFNKVRPPNNDNNCEGNPDDEEYQRQIHNTMYY